MSRARKLPEEESSQDKSRSQMKAPAPMGSERQRVSRKNPDQPGPVHAKELEAMNRNRNTAAPVSMITLHSDHASHDSSRDSSHDSSAHPAAAPASLIRGIAGAPAGVSKAPNSSTPGGSRRGSFLVLVVGTLALLSVAAILYVAIGNRDIRTKAAIQKRERLDDVPERFASYVAEKIVAADALATFYDASGVRTTDSSGREIPVLMREAMDYPSIDYARRSNSFNPTDPAYPAEVFNPVGTYDPSLGVTNLPGKWLPTDPWLAASEPTFLDFAQANATDPARPYLDRRDWANISNVSPDGRFVNLRNLRGNFSAPSATLSTNLSLWDEDGQPTNTTDFGIASDINIPAHWTARQRGAFRPVIDTSIPVTSPDWPGYQWADADGDGMYDSRIFELVDARDAANIIDLLGADESYRWFFATRIVDLSGRVNVTTAGDILAEATREVPVGLTPTDVDLRRLLMMTDVFAGNGTVIGSGLIGGYDGIFQSSPITPLTAPSNYGPLAGDDGYDEVRAFNVGRFAYNSLRLGLIAGIATPISSSDGTLVFRGDALTTAGTAGDAVTALNLGGQANFYDFSIPANRRNLFNRVVETFTSSIGITSEVIAGETFYRPFSTFGIADQAELLTYNASNNPAVTSALELTLSSRDDSDIAPLPGSTRFSPLRDNRPLDLELRRYTGAFTGTPGAGSDIERTMLHFASDLRQRLTTVAAARQIRTTRGVDPARLSDFELKIDARTAALNPSIAFVGYAEALLPTSDIRPTTNPAINSWADPSTGILPTLAYGHQGPQLAALISASMAANLGPVVGVTTPGPFTLILNGSDAFREELDDDNDGAGTDDRDLPDDQKVFPGWHNNKRFDLGSARLATASDPIAAPAVNVFPVQAQPFVTEVATYTVYTDTVDTAGGDIEPVPGEVTIQSDLNVNDNVDALYQVIAFKLHNPFNVQVRLSGNPALRASPTDTDETLLRYLNVADPAFPALDRDPLDYHYIEYLGRTYKLASLVEQTYVTSAIEAELQDRVPPVPARSDDARVGEYVDPAGDAQFIVLEGITIAPGGTVVCYALSQSPRRILQRMNNADPVLAPNSNRAAYIRSVIESQLADDSDIDGVHWIPEIAADTEPNPGSASLPDGTRSGPGLRNMEFRQVAGAGPTYVPPPATTHEAVNLYRSVRIGDELDTDQAVPNLVGNPPLEWPLPATYWDGQTDVPTRRVTLPPRNTRSNDQLVDRLKLPLGFSLNRVLPTPGAGVNQRNIGSTESDNDDDQEGLTITTWATLRRPGTLAEPVLGAFPPYCVEPKRWVTSSGAGFRWNIDSIDNVNVDSLDLSDFASGPGSFTGGAVNLDLWRTNMLAETFSDNMAKAPNNITDSPIDGSTRINIFVPATATFAANAAEVIIAAEDISQRIRPADLLLPLGVAPMNVPLTAAAIPWTDATDPGALNRWTTLAEGMAMALGYDQRPATVPPIPSDILQLYYPQPNPDGGGTQITPLDRGNLRLDAYLPFFDASPAAIRAFTPGSDLRAGLEIPIALNVLDVFHTAGTATDSIERGVPGLVNINTASTPVLRSLPLLSPPPNFEPDNTTIWWWGNEGTSPNPVLDSTSDIAATVEAFREKSKVALRPGSAIFDGIERFNDEGGLTPDLNPELLDGRLFSTQIRGIGEQPGFRSIGAILAARYRTLDATSFAWPGNIDYMGFDKTGTGPTALLINNGRQGLDSVLYRTGGVTWAPDAIGNEYKERLTVANGLLSSITTRSDTFAVWFVVQGYRKGDVEGLTGNDPLVPSVQRRFLMIIDRSNVKALGDKPKILALRELPI
jgi:hypothetical protein